MSQTPQKQKRSKKPYVLLFIALSVGALAWTLLNTPDAVLLVPNISETSIDNLVKAKNNLDTDLLVSLLVEIDTEAENRYGDCQIAMALMNKKEWVVILNFSSPMNPDQAETAGLELVPFAVRLLKEKKLIGQREIRLVALEINSQLPEPADQGIKKQHGRAVYDASTDKVSWIPKP